jgi:hypothetical protein
MINFFRLRIDSPKMKLPTLLLIVNTYLNLYLAGGRKEFYTEARKPRF